MARGEWRGPYPRKPETPHPGVWRVAANGKVCVHDDGRFVIRSPVVRDLVSIYAHFEAQGERVVVFHDDPKRPTPGCYALAISGPSGGFGVKVKVENDIVHESGREELD